MKVFKVYRQNTKLIWRNMNLKNIITNTVAIVGYEGELDYSNPSKELNSLIDCAKSVFSELTVTTLALKTREKCFAEEGVIRYANLNKPCREVLNVYVGERKLKFTSYPTYVLLDEKISGEAEVVYLFHEPDVDLDKTLEVPPKITSYSVALGVSAEYFYRLGYVDEALFYKTRYENFLHNFKVGYKSPVLPSRRFIW